jgi:hypothetical protein
MKLLISLAAAVLLTPSVYASSGIVDGMGGLPDTNLNISGPEPVPYDFPPEDMPDGIAGSMPPAPEIQPAGGCRAQFLEAAKAYKGMRYVHGGESRKEGGVDCSGLVVGALNDLRDSGTADCPKDMDLLNKLVAARDTYKMVGVLPKIKREELKMGDLVFSDYGYKSVPGPGHVYIFIREGDGGNAWVMESGGTGDHNVAEEQRSIQASSTFGSMTPVLGE